MKPTLKLDTQGGGGGWVCICSNSALAAWGSTPDWLALPPEHPKSE
jgi:hypothetical protein